MSEIADEEGRGTGEQAERDDGESVCGLERVVDQLVGDGADQHARSEAHDQAPDFARKR